MRQNGFTQSVHSWKHACCIWGTNKVAYINAGEEEAGNKGFDYSKLPDEEAEEAREDLISEKGFFIRPSELFCNVQAKASNGETWRNPNGTDMLLNEIKYPDYY